MAPSPALSHRACSKSPMRVHWLGKWLDVRTQIRSIFRNMLRIEDAADGRLPPQGAPGGVSKQALNTSSLCQNMADAVGHRTVLPSRFHAPRQSCHAGGISTSGRNSHLGHQGDFSTLFQQLHPNWRCSSRTCMIEIVIIR